MPPLLLLPLPQEDERQAAHRSCSLSLWERAGVREFKKYIVATLQHYPTNLLTLPATVRYGAPRWLQGVSFAVIQLG